MAGLIAEIKTSDQTYVDTFTLSAAPTKIKGQVDSRSPMTIVIRDEDGNVVETREMTARAKGFFKFEPANELPDGNYTIEITALQNGEKVTETTAIQVDTVTEAPVIESVTPDRQDGNELLNFAGTAEANATVTLFAAGVMIGTAQADENGRWELPVDATNVELADITVEATDLAGNTESSTLEDDNEAPIFAGGQTFTYAENQGEGDVIATVDASDNIGIVEYAIVAGDEEGWFEIDNTGAIKLSEAGIAAAANDFESGANSFTLTIRVTDASGNETEQDVTLSVLEDDSEAPVIVGGQAFTYAENQREGDVIATVDASDNVGIAGYAIVSGNDEDWFEIDNTGAITLTEAGFAAAANDYESGANSFTLTIRATDAFGNVTEQDVTLSVSNELDTDAEIRAEIFEDSSSDGERGSNNGVLVSAEELSMIAQNVFRFSSENNALLESRYQYAISNMTGFSDTPTDDEIQAVVDSVNKDLSGLFYSRSAGDWLADWDVSGVETMSGMFRDSNFDVNIGGWNVSTVVDMSNMFRGAREFNQDIGGWDVGSVRDMSYMFTSSNFNRDISSWNVGNVEDMQRMFWGSDFNQSIGSWDVSNVQNMSAMFVLAGDFNQDLDDWNVSNVTNMYAMFNMAESFNGSIGNWDVSSVVDFSVMFTGAEAFNQDISRWDVSSATDMSSMFSYAVSFDRNIGGWDVSSVEDMAGMFLEAGAFDQDIGGWDISSLSRLDYFLDNSGMSAASYDKLLAGWSTLDVSVGETSIASGLRLDAGGLTYTDVTSKNHLQQTYGWSVGGRQASTDSEGRTIVAGDNSGTDIDLSGAAVAQAIHALDGDDTIIASALDDLIVGGAGDDVMTGGGGADTYVFRDYGGEQGDFGHDTITDFEAGAGAGDVIRLELTGLTNFTDLLTKATDTENGVLIQIDDGNSILLEGLTINDLDENDFEFVATDSKTFKLGSLGDDTLTGDDYNNRIDGRSGNDTLSGGAGEDTFVFKDGYGNDTISDFELATDLIEIDAGSADNFETLLALMSEENGGSDTVIDFGNGDTLTLENVSMDALTAGDFSFL